MQLPDRFKAQPRSKQLTEYIDRRYSTHGFPKSKAIVYNPEWTPEYSRDRYRWVENVSHGLRPVGSSDDIINLDHTGWYIDNFQDETVHGIVYQLPSRHGELQFVPAVNDPFNPDCACLDFTSITDDKTDAARWADQMAESWAEREREYQAKQDAETRLEEIAEEITAEYSEFRRIAEEIRANRLQDVGVVLELIRAHWQKTKDTIHRLRKERESIERNGIDYS